MGERGGGGSTCQRRNLGHAGGLSKRYAPAGEYARPRRDDVGIWSMVLTGSQVMGEINN